jgi:multiple sugar transport system permease protein
VTTARRSPDDAGTWSASPTSGVRAYLAALIVGAIWGGAIAVVIGLGAVLVGGRPATAPFGDGFLAGAHAGLVYRVLERHGARARVARLAVSAAAGLAAFLVLAGGRPFGLAIGTAPVWGLGGAVVAFVAVARAIDLTLRGIDLGRMGRHQVETIVLRTLNGLGLVVFTVLVALPFYVMLMTSLKTQAALIADPLDFSIDLAAGLGSLFHSYVEVLTTYRFGRYIAVSALVSIVTVLLTLAFAVPGAYAVARLRFPGQAFMARSILLIYLVPAIVLVIPLYSVFSQVGLRDTLLGLIIVYPATTLPVALYMLQGYFRGIPPELEEAGMIDGLSRFGVIRRITLPLSLPALASVSLYVFMIAWNEFLFAFMFLDNPDIFTLSRAIVSLNSSEVPRQFLMAGAVIVTVPVLVIFLWAERFMVQGLTAGSVKG